MTFSVGDFVRHTAGDFRITAVKDEWLDTDKGPLLAANCVLSGRSVLDHGFVRLVDSMGNDAGIVQAARVSTGSGIKDAASDRNLIRYLLRHKHTTPFEMVELKFHAKLPIFVARQWIRHRTASVNEFSMRYSEAREEFYVPEQFCLQAATNKQGAVGPVSEDVNAMMQSLLRNDSDEALSSYEVMREAGVSREQARLGLTVNWYTEWYWKVNLWNLMNFLRLRMDKHAQMEIRVYAEVMYELAIGVAPIAMSGFDDYILNAITLTALDIKAMQGLGTDDMTDRERAEYFAKMELLRVERPKTD